MISTTAFMTPWKCSPLSALPHKPLFSLPLPLFKVWLESHLLFEHSLATAFYTDPLSLTNINSHYLWDAFGTYSSLSIFRIFTYPLFQMILSSGLWAKYWKELLVWPTEKSLSEKWEAWEPVEWTPWLLSPCALQGRELKVLGNPGAWKDVFKSPSSWEA